MMLPEGNVSISDVSSVKIQEEEGCGVVQESYPITFAEMGIPQFHQLKNTLLGKSREFHSVDTIEKVFIVAYTATLLGALGVTVYKLATITYTNPDFPFALVLLCSILFSIYYTIHGVLQERASELLILCTSTAVVLTYFSVNYFKGQREMVKLVRLILAFCLCPPLVVIGLHLGIGYFRSRTLIFRVVGANIEMQKMCQRLFIFFDLLKFDFQLSLSMVIFVISSKPTVDTEVIVVLSVGGVITVLWFLASYFSAASYLDQYTGLASSTFACGIMAIAIRVLLVAVGAMVVANFNKGLKEQAFGKHLAVPKHLNCAISPPVDGLSQGSPSQQEE